MHIISAGLRLVQKVLHKGLGCCVHSLLFAEKKNESLCYLLAAEQHTPSPPLAHFY